MYAIFNCKLRQTKQASILYIYKHISKLFPYIIVIIKSTVQLHLVINAKADERLMKFRSIKIHFDRSLGWAITSKPTGLELTGWFPALPLDFSLEEPYSTVCGDLVFLSCNFLYCLRRRPLHSADHRLWEAI